MPRTLILKLGAIGDVLMAIPAAHQLHLAGHAIDWVCGPAVLPILQLYPWINPILADEPALLKGNRLAKTRALAALWRALAGRRYDLAATLYYDPRYRLLTLPVRARRKLQLSPTDRTLRLLPGRHHTDEYARILLNRPDRVTPHPLAPVPPPSFLSTPEPGAAGLASETWVRTTSSDPNTPHILLAPAGARNLMADDALRRWPAPLYVSLAQLLLAHGFHVALIGGPGDTWVQPLFAGLPVTDRIAQLTLPETLALMHASSLVVTHDTGPLHLAGITRAAIVALFGPTDPRGRLPQRPGTTAIWGGEGFACRPCYDGRTFAPCPSNDCMSQITPTLVLTEILTLLNAPTPPPPRITTPTSTVTTH